MADQPQKLTLADQVVINGLYWLTTSRVDDRNKAMVLAVIDDFLPRTSEEHPAMKPLTTCAEVLVDCSKGSSDGWAGAIFDASQAMSRFALWRMGLAQEALNKQEGGGS